MKKLTTLLFLIVAGNALGQTWKIDADARIAQNRKGALKVVVIDESGNPLSGAAVDVQMQRHSFNFGAAIQADVLADAQNGVTLSSDDQNELDKILAYCNTVVFKNDLKWRTETSNTASLVSDALDFAEANRLAVRGHTILWPHEDKNGAVNHDFLLPDDSYSNSDIVDQWTAAGQTDTPAFTAWIQQSVTDRINRMASTYPGRFFEWDMINEFNDADSTGNDIWLERRWSGDTIDLVNPAGGNYSPTTAGKQQLADIRAEWIKLASQANYGGALFLNNYNLMRFNPGHRHTAMENIVASLNDPARANAPGALGGIGMQSHMSAEPTLPDDIWNRLEAYGSLDRNLKLSITEYDYVTTNAPIEINEADQLEYILTQTFSHPQADCFIMWGIWDGNQWKDNGPMYDIDWNLKLSGQRYLDLAFGEWWTDESGTSDINGEYDLDAFHGEHLVTVTVNGKTYQKTVTLDPAATNQTIAVMSIANAPVVESAFVRGGQADTPQAWTDALDLKNANVNFNRIAMIKVDASGISNNVDSAVLTVYDTDSAAHSLYVYGVHDSASFQDWTGGGSGSATWNSVSANGLFNPIVDLYDLGGTNLTLLGSQELFGTNTIDAAVTISGQALVDLLNNDSDGLVTLVVCTDANASISVRPHTHANAPTLGLIITNLPPAFGSDPINKPNAFEDTAYSGSIVGNASDPESNPMTFSKISGPAWLNVSTNGTLSGTPLASDAGLNTWTVQVSDSYYGTDTAVLTIYVIGNALPLLDSAFVRGGADADTPQAWTDALDLKNANETYTRIAMFKVDALGISSNVDSATLTVYDTDVSAHSLYVYGVHDSASFQDWTGGGSGFATWNSVIANGLFTPKVDLHTLGDANLTLLGSQALAGANVGDVAVTVSGQALIDFLNNDTDDLVTLVICTDANAPIKIRPHTHANAPTLDIVRVPNLTYDSWLSDYLSWLGSETNKTDNKDGDSFNNLAEYALGGNPTNGTDTTVVPIAQMMQAGGTNYIEYVHLQRNDTDSLEYRVEVTTNLISGIWTNTLVQIIGTNTASGVDGFDAVTNRVPAGPKQQFIHLKIK